MASCAACGGKEYLQEHHLSYEPEVTVTLCSDCHSKVHGHCTGSGVSSKKIEVAAAMKDGGYSYGQIGVVFDVTSNTASNWVDKSDIDVSYLDQADSRSMEILDRCDFVFDKWDSLVGIRNFEEVEIPE